MATPATRMFSRHRLFFPSTVTVAAAPADNLRGRDRGAGVGEGPRSAEGVGGGRRAPGLRPLGRAPRQALCRRPRAGDHRQSRRLSSVCPDLYSAAPLSPRPASPWPRTHARAHARTIGTALLEPSPLPHPGSLRSYFEAFGVVLQVLLPLDSVTHRSRGRRQEGQHRTASRAPIAQPLPPPP